MSKKQSSKTVSKNHKKIFTASALVIFVAAGLTIIFLNWSNKKDENAYNKGLEALTSANYNQSYEYLKEAEPYDGSYQYYTRLAEAAYLSGDKKSAQKYADIGIRKLPPQDTPEYTNAQTSVISLLEIKNGNFTSPYYSKSDIKKSKQPKDGDE